MGIEIVSTMFVAQAQSKPGKISEEIRIPLRQTARESQEVRVRFENGGITEIEDIIREPAKHVFGTNWTIYKYISKERRLIKFGHIIKWAGDGPHFIRDPYNVFLTSEEKAKFIGDIEDTIEKCDDPLVQERLKEELSKIKE